MNRQFSTLNTKKTCNDDNRLKYSAHSTHSAVAAKFPRRLPDVYWYAKLETHVTRFQKLMSNTTEGLFFQEFKVLDPKSINTLSYTNRMQDRLWINSQLFNTFFSPSKTIKGLECLKI